MKRCIKPPGVLPANGGCDCGRCQLHQKHEKGNSMMQGYHKQKRLELEEVWLTLYGKETKK